MLSLRHRLWTWLPRPELPHRKAPAVNRRRLRLEALEDRTLLTAGVLDPTFGNGGLVITPQSYSTHQDRGAAAVAVQSDGKIVVAGYTNSGGSPNGLTVARYAPNGTLDTSFASGGVVTTNLAGGATAIAIQPDGKIVVAGNASPAAASNDLAVARFTAAGALDTSFGAPGTGVVTNSFFGQHSDAAYGLAIQSDGKLVVAGDTSTGNGGTDFLVARYTQGGTLDTSFGPTASGFVATDFSKPYNRASAVAIQPNGKIVVAGKRADGFTEQFVLARYTVGGTLDTSFGTGGKVTSAFSDSDRGHALVIQSDGKIVVVGDTRDPSGSGQDFALARYTVGGSLDNSFGKAGNGLVTTDFGHGVNYAWAVALQPDGKIVAAGEAWNGSDLDFAVARYTTTGALDATFGPTGNGLVTTDFLSANDIANGMALQADGKIVVAGQVSDGSNTIFGVARYLGDTVTPTGLSLSNSSVLELRPAGTAVGTFSTTEAGSAHSYTYSLVSGTGSADNASFSVSGNQLLTAAAFDSTARSSYSVRVRTTDEKGQYFEQPFTLTITADPNAVLLGGQVASTAAGLSGWTVQVSNPSTGQVVRSTSTDSNGNYTVRGLPGTYRVRVVLPSGWAQLSAYPPDVTLTAGQNVSGINFVVQSYGGPGVPVPGNLAVASNALSHSDEHYSQFITAAYEKYLGRQPDAAGLAGWLQAMKNGFSDEQLEAGFIGAAEYIADHGGQGAGWVTGMYQDLLGRTPAQAEVNAWVAALNNGVPPQQVAYGFAASAEREGIRVRGDYLSFLGRSPGQAEVDGWVNAFTHGYSNESVVGGFVGSPEDFAQHGSQIDIWLEGAYLSILGRLPGTAEMQAWSGFLR